MSTDISKRRMNSQSLGSKSDEKVEKTEKVQLETIQSLNQSAPSSKSRSQSQSLLQSLISGYKSTTSSECKSIDAFLLFTMLTGIAQSIYCGFTNGFPYNTFIGVFSASVGSFVFAGKITLFL